MMRYKTGIVILLLLSLTATAGAERIKDITDIKGVRGNPLYGYGIVIGLNGTGDNSDVTKRAVANMLRTMNMTFDADDIDAANVASVIVTAELGPWDRTGSRIDVKVSTFGPASSLRGGTLLMTALAGADKRTYAVAQGSVVIGGFGASGNNASVQRGHLTSGAIPDGAIVEREEVANVLEKGEITLLLKNPDATTAESVSKAINSVYENAAHAADEGTIRIKVPGSVNKTSLNQFISDIGQLEVTVDQPAKVIINEKTGTIVVGQNVIISTVAIAHGTLTITTEEKDYASQPEPFSGDGATTETLERTSVKISEKRGRLNVVPRQATLTVTQLAEALNAMGMNPTDLISIFRALKSAGALQAELVVV